MKTSTIIVNIVAVYLFLVLISCKDNSTELPEDETTYKIIDTTFYSQLVGDSIKLDISFPSGYSENPGKVYPVIYLTDGYWRREEHSTIHRMSDNAEIPHVIVVGIGYPDNYDFNNIRTRDLIVNADKLLSCIKTEVINIVETKYRADSMNRTLWGSSYGGYFLVYSFTEHFNRGSLFKNYICASAALNPPYPHADLLDNEKALWSRSAVLPVNLYVTVGSLETSSFIDSYNQIVNAIKSHPYQNFRFEYEIIPDTDHYTVWKPTLLNGLKKFLNN